MMPANLPKMFAITAILLTFTAFPPAAKGAAAHGSRDAASGENASKFTLDGKITQVKPGELTLNTQDNILFHVRYDDQTEIKRSDGSQGSAKDLVVNAQVHVEGELEESGEIAATKIELRGTDSKEP